MSACRFSSWEWSCTGAAGCEASSSSDPSSPNLIAIPLAFAAAVAFIALSVRQVLLYLSFARADTPGMVQAIGFGLIASVLSFLAFQRVKG